MVYGKTCHLLVELEFKSHWAMKRWNMNLQAAGVWRQIQIVKLEEWREKAYHSAKLYKERTKRWHDKRLRNKVFKPSDKVLLYNSCVRLFGHGKLRTKWEGPFKAFMLLITAPSLSRTMKGEFLRQMGNALRFSLSPNNPNSKKWMSSSCMSSYDHTSVV